VGLLYPTLLRSSLAFLASRSALAARQLLLERQLALFVERGAKLRLPSNAERLALVALSTLAPDWRRHWIAFRPETLVRWQRREFRFFTRS
jgi:hypothetical protein